MDTLTPFLLGLVLGGVVAWLSCAAALVYAIRNPQHLQTMIKAAVGARAVSFLPAALAVAVMVGAVLYYFAEVAP